MDSETTGTTRRCDVSCTDIVECSHHQQEQEQQPEQLHHRQTSMKCLPTRSGQGSGALQHSSHHQQLRKSNKPLMEKRRRERINNCLDQLKSILMEVSKKESSFYSKLEKADILEMTVKYLKNLKRQHLTATSSAISADFDFDDSVGGSNDVDEQMSKYVAGFNECAAEVNTYLASIDGRRSVGVVAECSTSPVVGSSSSSKGTTTSLDHEVRGCLLEHLADSLTRTTTVRQSTSSPDTTTKTNAVVAHRMQYGIVNERRPLLSFPTPQSQSNSSYSLLSLDVGKRSPLPPLPVFSAPPVVEDEVSIDSRLRSTGHPTQQSILQRRAEIAATTATDGTKLPSLQVLPARLASGELVFLLAGGGASVDNRRSCDGQLGRHSPALSDRRSLELKSPTRISPPTVSPPYDNGGIRDVPGITVRSFRSVTSPTSFAPSSTALAKPLDFSFRSAGEFRSLPLQAYSKLEAEIDVREQSAVDNKMLADLANNNDPSFQSMWRPW